MFGTVIKYVIKVRTELIHKNNIKRKIITNFKNSEATKQLAKSRWIQNLEEKSEIY